MATQTDPFAARQNRRDFLAAPQRLCGGPALNSWLDLRKPNCVLRTGVDTQPTCSALIGSWRVRNLSAVNPISELREDPQLGVVSWLNVSNLEYVVRTHLRARTFRFAPREIYERDKLTLRMLADVIIHIVFPAESDTDGSYHSGDLLGASRSNLSAFL
jgi:hypothetical protein